MNRMTAAELIAALSLLPPETVISLDVGDPKDSAYTDEILSCEDGVIRGWISSDNEAAFAPWAER